MSGSDHAPRTRAILRAILRPGTRPRSDAGFSLIEVMISLFILSLISSAGVAMLIVAVNGSDQVERETTFLRAFDTARATLKADLGQVVARPVRDPFGGQDPSVFRGGFEGAGGPLLAFARSGWTNPDAGEARGGLMQVEYAVRDGVLIRRTWARIDPTFDTPQIETPLLDGVRGVQIAFGRDQAWTSGWDAARRSGEEGALPTYVELTLDLADAGQVRQLFLVAPGYTPP